MFAGKRITVVQPDPAYLLATKIAAGRQQDIDDAVALMAVTGHRSVEGLCDLVAGMYGSVASRNSDAVRANAEQAIRRYNTR